MKFVYPWNNHEPKADTEFYFNVDKNGKCTICFNGSERLRDSLKDWLYNLMFWRSLQFDIMLFTYGPEDSKHDEYKYFTVHYGLFRKWELVRLKLSILIAFEPIIKSYEITGYSQGASTAIFCHRWLKSIGDKTPIKTTVAGAPKLFGLLGLKRNRELCKDIICLQNKNDIVTKIPPLMFSVGTIKQFGKRCPFVLSVKDHLLPNYNEIIK